MIPERRVSTIRGETIAKFKELRRSSWSGIWAKRILSQIHYLMELEDSMDEEQKEILEDASDQLWNYVKENGAVTRDIVLDLEKTMEKLVPTAKSLKVLLIAHAHIDMNWMWGFQETASVTVDTFETVLNLMQEFPQFTFSQSQASVYRIIERYYPELLDKIREKVREGRWEVTASSWVENDKNMSDDESMARHLLYTRNYLAELLNLSPDSLKIDFEPDTFGHSENMPEILSKGGVKYYYHCRGYDKEHVYRWRAPSGAEVLVYREPVWYNDEEVEYDCLGYVPGFCKAYGLTTAMKVYGVGDHGGGPTRRDIRRWIQMQEWPLMPQIQFGTLGEFFSELEKIREKLPVVSGELNYIFTGCYTSQARIKRANKLGEIRMYESEAADTMAHILVPGYKTASPYQGAWERILFNQFHDILPGSGVMETKDYALGKSQEALAVAQINLNHAMRSICREIDTEKMIADFPERRSFFQLEEGEDARSYGAGAGFGTEERAGGLTGFSDRSCGKERMITVFNPTHYFRKEIVKVMLWDWDGDGKRLSARDERGNEIPCQCVEEGTHYWGHHYTAAFLLAEVEPLGYASYLLGERQENKIGRAWEDFFAASAQAPRVDRLTDRPLTLENDKVKAVFSPDTMKLISFVDKETGLEKILEPACGFRLITENTVQEMTAWRVGQYTKAEDLNKNRRVRVVEQKQGELFQKIIYELRFSHSRIEAEVSLKQGAAVLEFDVKTDWHELGNKETGVPQLGFSMPLGYQTSGYLCSIPFGIKKRRELAQDVPCTGFMCGAAEDGQKPVTVMSDCKYGFRGYHDTINLALLRSSYDPDKTPDQGEHLFRIGVGISTSENEVLTEQYQRFLHPMYACSNSIHPGTLSASDSLLKIKGNVKVTAVKWAEDGEGMVLRMHSLQGENTPVIIKTCRKVSGAQFTDIAEKRTEKIAADEKNIRINLPAYSVRTMRITFKNELRS